MPIIKTKRENKGKVRSSEGSLDSLLRYDPVPILKPYEREYHEHYEIRSFWCHSPPAGGYRSQRRRACWERWGCSPNPVPHPGILMETYSSVALGVTILKNLMIEKQQPLVFLGVYLAYQTITVKFLMPSLNRLGLYQSHVDTKI
jgi:hypothetical protein